MQNIRCTNPQIIYNPYIVQLMLQHRVYYFRGQRKEIIYEMWLNNFRWSLISPKVNNIKPYEVDSCYILDEVNGEVFPMFMVVPCGKCALCDDRKLSDWKCRAICETATSTNIPYFVTLTYDNENLPSDRNVSKKELQDFMKRFRYYLAEAGLNNNIRYAACGEYGSKYGRPHYHLIFWNLPTLKQTWLLTDYIEKAWTKGFCYIKVCDSNCISYVMKYIRKSREGKHPNAVKPFFLSSRKNGGLGSQWLRDNMQFFINHPTLSFEIGDPFTGKTQKFGLPKYFVNKIYPTMCNIVPKDIRDAYKKLHYSHGLLSRYYDILPDFRFDIVKEKFAFLPSFDYKCFTTYHIDHHVHHNKTKAFQNEIGLLVDMYDESLSKLLHYQVDYELLERTAKLKDVRDKLVREFIDSHEISLEYIENTEKMLNRREYESSLREIF